MEEFNFPGFNTAPWMAFFVPANTPKEIVQTIATKNLKILMQKDDKDRMTQLGFELTPSTPLE